MVTTADSLAGEFWKAIIGCGRQTALRIGAQLFPLALSVQLLSYVFPNSPHGAGLVGEGASTTAAGGFSLHAAKSDTPKTTVDGWNSYGVVTWLVVSSKLTCGLRLGLGGNLDFIACGRDAIGCVTLSHKCKGVKRVSFPEYDGEALTIQVRKSSQIAKTWIFSQLLLHSDTVPQQFQIQDEERLMLLTSLEFPTRVFRFLTLAHGGYDWMMDLTQLGPAATSAAAPATQKPPPLDLNIPSP